MQTVLNKNSITDVTIPSGKPDLLSHADFAFQAYQHAANNRDNKENHQILITLLTIYEAMLD